MMKPISAVAVLTALTLLAAGCKPAGDAEPAAATTDAPAVADAASNEAPEAPAQLNVTRSITIAAPADAVWSRVKDFNGLPGWHPAVAKSEIVEGENNAVGAVRVLTLAGDPTPPPIKERLTALDEAGKTFSYEILEGPLPVSGYSSSLSVVGGADSATVTWSSTFMAQGADDETATATIEGVYSAGLDNLKAISEAK